MKQKIKPHQVTKKVGKEASSSFKIPIKEYTPLLSEIFSKKAFLIISILGLVIMLITNHQYGITGDEVVQRNYGERILSFYTGNEIPPKTKNDTIMDYYGGMFDATAQLLTKISPSNEWNIRHLYNATWGCVAIIFTGLIAVEIAGWQAGLITLLFMFFSPRFFGESMNNPKDIPYTTGYVIAYYFLIKFFKQLPKPNLKATIGLGLGIGIAIGVRIGGVLLLPYFYLFYAIILTTQFKVFKGGFDNEKFRMHIWPSFKYVLLASGVAYIVGIAFWPYALKSPFVNPLKSLSIMSKYPLSIKLLFEGELISSMEVPSHYIPKWLWISTPLFGIIGTLLSFLFIKRFYKEKKHIIYLFLLFTIAFPIAYLIYEKSVLYDSMRHVFFIYPSIIIIAGLTFDYLIKTFSSKGVKYVIASLIIILIALPGRFMFANHPNEYVYFNETIGGIKGAFGNYETDYYMNSLKECTDWLKKNEKLNDGGKKKMILSNNAHIKQYFMEDTAYVSTMYTRYYERDEKDCDYLILYCRFIDPVALKNGYWPPEQTIYTSKVDGIPISCIIKRTDHSLFQGITAMQKNDFASAISLMEPYVKKFPYNETAWSNLGYCYLNNKKIKEAIEALSFSLRLHAENPFTTYWLGMAYFQSGDTSNGVTMMERTIRVKQDFPMPYKTLSMYYASIKDDKMAKEYDRVYKLLTGAK